MACSEKCFGESPEGFLTRRAALEEEEELRWVGGFSSHVSLLLPRNSLVQLLRVTVFAVYTSGMKNLRCWSVVWLISRLDFVVVSRAQTAFGGGRWVGLDRRTEGGRIVGVAARVACESILPPVTKTQLFLLRSYLSRVRSSNSARQV